MELNRPDFKTSSDLYDAIGHAMDGNTVDDIIPALTYMLGEALAQKSHYVADPQLAADVFNLLTQAYQLICAAEASDNIALN